MTELDVVNRALAFLGSRLADSMADVSKNAARAITAYEECRDEVLRQAIWNCAVRRLELYDCNAQATPWAASHRYGVGERCTNDTDKTYTCTVSGKSDTSGGPTGTGTGIEDGTCEWDYVEDSDAENNWCHWPSTPYEEGEICSWDKGKIYVATQAGTTHASNPPVGEGDDIVDGTVRWRYYGQIKSNLTIHAYQYVLPPESRRVLKIPVVGIDSEKDQGNQYMVEGKCIYTDQEDAFAICVALVPVSEWDSLLRGTVAMRLAAEIAFDVTGQKDFVNLAFQALGAQYQGARMASQNERQEGTPEPVRWEDA